jgi:D,D-heptose 1,7-bisphosphate phosphatase
MGTAGCLYKIRSKVSENFFIINGDTFFDINLNKMYELKKKNKYILASTLSKNYKSNKQLNKLSINKKDNIIYKNNSGNLMNGGCYLFDKSIFKKIRNKYQSLEVLVEDFIKIKKFIGYKSKNLFIDIGTPKSLKKSKKIFYNYFNRPALFLDRDGTINEDNGYVHKKKDLVFKNQTLNLIKKFINRNYWIFIVTNQAGVSKKKFTLKDFKIFQNYLKYKLSKKNILINDIRYCLYHKDAQIISLKKNSNYRKPGNLMIKNILKEWDINLSKSLMIGDKISDKQCAENSNLNFYFTKHINKIKI